jgi:sugar lactone lactonase YvrE
VISPAGQLIGRIHLPEICANICFGGPNPTAPSSR